MSDAKRWLVVDAADDTKIVGGPYLWDGVSAWTPPEEGWLVPEAEWLATHPPAAEQPEQPE